MAQRAQQTPVSERLALAQLASHVALDSHEVAALRDVQSIAVPGGRYEVTLHVIARPVSLGRLGTHLRERVRRSADAHGLGDVLGAVNVTVTDVVSVEEAG
jgi:hypothetical protein